MHLHYFKSFRWQVMSVEYAEMHTKISICYLFMIATLRRALRVMCSVLFYIFNLLFVHHVIDFFPFFLLLLYFVYDFIINISPLPTDVGRILRTKSYNNTLYTQDPSCVRLIEANHRCTSQGAGRGRLQPPQTRAKPLFFGQKQNFSGRSQKPKMRKYICL